MLETIFEYIKENIWLVVFAGFFITAAWLAWQNRGSERVKAAIITGLAVGITGALITLPASEMSIWLRFSIITSATLATILINLKNESKTVEFPAVSIYEKASKRPLEAINATYRDRFSGQIGFCPVEFIVSRMPEENSDDELGQEKYFDVLFRLILDHLNFLYRNVWDIKVIRYNLQYGAFKFEPNERAPSGDFIAREDFVKIFPDCRALSVETLGHIGESFAVPYGTYLRGETKFFRDKNKPYKREFSLKNSFVQVTIELTSSTWSVGIGELGMYLNFTREVSEKFCSQVSDVKLSAKFNRLKIGHPEMFRYRRWVDVMFEEIQEGFDAVRHRKRGKDWYLLSKVSLIKSET